MAQTTGAISAQNCVIIFDGVDISGSANRVNINPTREIGRTKTFSGNFNISVPGKRDWDGNIRAVYTEVSGEAMDKLWAAFIAGTAKSLVVRPKGTAVGNWEWSGNVLVTSAPFDLDGNSSDVILAEIPFVGDGDLARATQT